jgi:hypothetical protein
LIFSGKYEISYIAEKNDMSYPSKILDTMAVMDSLKEYASPHADKTTGLCSELFNVPGIDSRDDQG